MKCKLLEMVVNANTGADAIKRAPIVSENTGIRCLRIGDVSQQRPFSEWGFTKTTDDDFYKYQLKLGDTIIARTGNTIGVNTYIDTDLQSVYNNGLIRVQVNKDIIYPRYFYYLIKSKSCQDFIQSIAFGTSTQPNMKIKDFLQYEFKYFDKKIQYKIIRIIEPIEEKIKLNNAINNNLAEQIKNICTAWLSDYTPFDGVVPSSWIETPLSDIADFVSGYSYKSSELLESNIAMATIKNFDRTGGFKLDGYKEIVPSSKLKITQHAELFDTLVAHTDLTQNAEVIGNAELVMSKSGYEDIVFSMDLVKVLPKENTCISKFLIAAILQDKKFKAHCLGYVNGTTVLHLSKKALPEYRLFLPKDLSELKSLDEVVTFFYKKLSANIIENMRLEQIRDSLLPKLMSGELDISDIDI